MKKINKLIIVLIVLFNINCKSQIISTQNNFSQDILGTWVSSGDNLWSVVFTNDSKRIDYYDNEQIDIYNFSIENSCGENQNKNLTYLKVTEDDGNNSFTKCYEIISINYNNNGKLSIMDLDRGKIFLFDKL